MSPDNDLERELEEIRTLLRDYIDDSVERREQQRAENIQILVALGILGAFITLYAQEIVSNSPLRPFFWMIAMASSGFLTLKTLVSPLAIGDEDGILTKLDSKWSLYAYVFLISLSFFIGSLFLIPFPPITLPDIQGVEYELVTGIIGSVTSILITFYFRNSITRVSEKRRKTQRRLQETLNEFKEMDIVHLFLNHPDLLSDLLQENIKNIEAEPQFEGLRPDLLASTKKDAKLIVELKVGGLNQKSRGLEQIRRYINEYNKISDGTSEIIGCLVIVEGTDIHVTKVIDDEIVSQYNREIDELISEFPALDFETVIETLN